jgi:amino acid transporter
VLGISALVLVGVWVAAPGVFGGWLTGAVFVSVLVLWFATQTRMRAYAPSDEAPEEDEAKGMRAGRTLWNLFGVAAGAFAVVLLVWNTWRWQPVAGAVLLILTLLGTLDRVRSWRGSSGRRAQHTSEGPPSR